MRIGRPRGRGDKTAGYTLLELSVVASITMVMAGVSLPAMATMTARYRADAAPRQLMGDLRFAQSQAISRGMEARVVIYTATGVATGSGNANTAAWANRYRVEARPTGGAWPAATATMATNGNVLSEWLDLGRDYNQSVTTANAVVFTSRGSLQNSPTSLNIVMSTGGGSTRTVRTHPSGLVEIL